VSLLGTALEGIYRPRGGLWGWGGGRSTHAGKSVTVERALGLVPVFNAVSQIAGAVGSLPLVVYERDGRNRQRAESHPAWKLLHEKPNPEMAADELWEIVASHIELWGNAFLYKRTEPGTGLTEQLWPISPDRVQVARDERHRRVFHIEGETFGEDTILHIRGFSLDGLVGYSPIQLARNAIANQMSQEEFQGKFLRSGGKPAVLLRHPNRLKDDGQKRLKASWDAVKAGETAVLEEKIEVERWTMPLGDAQFVEQMEFSDKRIAQLFVMRPGRVGAKTGDSMTYKNIESEALDFVTFTLQRRLTRIERALGADLSIFPGGRSEFCEFLVDALMRADLKERYEAYKVGIDAGFLDADEDVRPRENLAPRSAAPGTSE
jgi:HK97 family phage portal protein